MRRKTRLEKIRRKRKQILAIAQKHGVSNIRVFGSTVRGDELPTSDLDLLVRVGKKPGPWFPAGLSRELGELLGIQVDVVTERALNPDLRPRILEEAIPL